MLTRKTQYAWMALGGLICLFGLVLVCKLRDGNKAIAQADKLSLPPLVEQGEAKLSAPPPALMSKPMDTPLPTSSLPMLEPEKILPPKGDKTKEPAKKEKTSEPKATLNMPFPAEPLPAPTVLPASFGPNTPTHAQKKDLPALPSLNPLDRPPQLPAPPHSGDKAQSKPMLPFVMSGLKSTSNIGTDKPPATPSSPTKPATPKTGSEGSLPPSWNAPVSAAAPSGIQLSEHETIKTQPGEPPLAPAPGPVQLYHVHGTETLQDIARRTLGSSERWSDLHKLNPALKPDEPLRSGTTVRLPADACVQADDAEPIKPLPALRPKPTAPKAKALPLTGTYQCSLDEKGQLTLPRAIRDQLNSSDTVLLSPGPDKCLWLTNQPHLERLGEHLEQSQANEADVRVFKRLYFAQTEKLSVNGDGRVAVPERLSQFAGLHQEVVLVGIDDHFEVWDAARWRSYTQQKSAARSAALAEPE
jgi:MraZ protein